MTNLQTLCSMKYIFTRTNLNCQNTSFTNFYFPIVSIRLFEEVAMKRWVCPICKTLYFTIAIFKTSVSQLQTSFTIDKHQLHKCPRAEVAMKRWVYLIWKNTSFTIDKHPLHKSEPNFQNFIFHNWKPVSQLISQMSQCRGGNEKASLPNLQNWQNPFHNSSSKLMALKVLPPVCPATCESNLMAINGAPLSSRYHPLQYNALYAQRKMWPTGCEWCPSWEHQHVIWICQTLLISFKSENQKKHMSKCEMWNPKIVWWCGAEDNGG